MSSMLKLAEEIAREAHRGQKRSDGKPYITHPEAVAKKVELDSCKIVAWLHDVIEDSEFETKDLIIKGLPINLVHAVQAITRYSWDTYLSYILKVKGNNIARVVKIADLKHNQIGLKNGSMKDKYALALYILEDYKWKEKL